MKFKPSATTPIVAEMFRQGFAPDQYEAARTINLDYKDTSTDRVLSLATAATGLTGVGLIVVASGPSAPIVAPLIAVVTGVMGMWNSRVTMRSRQHELRFLNNCPEFLEAAKAKMHQMSEPAELVGNAYEAAFMAYRSGDMPMLAGSQTQTQKLTGHPAEVPLTVPTVVQPSPIAYPQAEVPMPSAVQPGMTTQSQTTMNGWGGDFEEPKPPSPEEQLWEIVDRDNSFFIVGSKGAGKGMTVANILRRKLEQYPNSIALVFDPKGDSKEDGYWAHPRIKRHSFRGLQARSSVWNQEADAFLNQVYHHIGQVDIRLDKRLFIVFDEMMACKQKLSKEAFAEIVETCSSSTSMGDSEGVHVIAITQSMNAGDSVGSEELMKNMCLVAVFRQDNFSRAKKLIKHGKVNTDNLTEAQFATLLKASPVDRVMSVGGVFIPAPKLVNYSSYDRDTGSDVAPIETPNQPFVAPVIMSEGDVLAAQVREQMSATMTLEAPKKTLAAPSEALQVEAAIKMVSILQAQGNQAVLDEAEHLYEQGQQKQALHVMARAISPTVTSFCKVVGDTTNGDRFKRYAALYAWFTPRKDRP